MGLLPLLALLLSGCHGPQSAFNPASAAAESIVRLSWWMFGGAAVVWLLVIGLAVYAIRLNPRPHDTRRAGILIIGGGVLFPTVVLGGLLSYGLSMLPEMVAPAPEGSLQIEVSGEQWWWRVAYRLEGKETVALANEIHLPIDEPVEFLLTSPDVVHSFWIPSLGRKLDMIPGRETRLSLLPNRVGTFRGVCAEYCGESHTYMAFYVVVEEKAAFESWLERQESASPPPSVAEDPIQKGYASFLANGCGACHAVRGTSADGVVGPDLTHVGGRLAIGAGLLPNDPEGFERWLAQTEVLKPGVGMPHFGMLPQREIAAMALYLESLQ